MLHVLSASFCNIRQTGYSKCSSPLISSVAPDRASKWGTTAPCRPVLANKPAIRRCIVSTTGVKHAAPARIPQFIWYGSLAGLLAIKECGPKQCRNILGYKMLFVTGQTAQRCLLCNGRYGTTSASRCNMQQGYKINSCNTCWLRHSSDDMFNFTKILFIA